MRLPHRAERVIPPLIIEFKSRSHAADTEWLLAQTKTSQLDVLIIDPTTKPGIEKGSHAFWYQSPWVSNDAMLNIELHASPASRGLAEHEN